MDDVLKRYPNHPGALQLSARWDLADGRPVQALERAKAAVVAAPRDVTALYLLGTLQSVNGQPEAAATTFNQVLKLNPRAAAAQIQASQLSLSRGDSVAALGLAHEAVSNAPGTPEARLVLARALVAERDYARADSEINQLLVAFPRASAVHSLKGTLLLLKGDFAASRQAYERVDRWRRLDLGADGIDHARYAAAASRRGAGADGVAARAVDDKRPDLLVLAAKVYVVDGHPAKAEQVLRKAIVLAPGLPDPYRMLVDIYRAENRLGPAQAEFDG